MSPPQPKETTKGYSEAVISEPLKGVNSNNGKKPEEQIRSLKQQRAIWGTLATVFLLFIFVDKVIPHSHSEQPKNENSLENNNTPIRTKENPIDTKEFLINSLSNSFEALLVIEKDNNGNQSESTLYAHKSIIKGNSCENDKFEIQPKQNIPVRPNNESKPDHDTFGQLINKTEFKKLEFPNTLGWCKFKLEGYIKNEVPVKR